jgi:4-alpha-glucanotransferase
LIVTTPARPARSAGIILHPTSLPGPYGIGDLGPAAYQWVDTLVRAKQKWWQVLPLGPTGYGDSPYQCFSAFAGNPYLVSPEFLLRDGLLQPNDIGEVNFPTDRVDFGPVIQFKVGILKQAWVNFQAGQAAYLRSDFDAFLSRYANWLADYALFMALKDAHGGASWLDWPIELVCRDPARLAVARRDLADAIGRHEFAQFLFFRQWKALKDHANGRGIRLVGDAPIFVSSDSSDVWANPDLFYLDERRRPTFVAGVPPDYFSATGQLWGNPLYNWDALGRTNYAWWTARMRATLELVDVVRLDHFRGFEAYWEIPAGMPTAEKGRWVKGPMDALFDTMRRELGGLPLIAEDLGIITPEVEALRDRLELPGMCVLQFAFSAPDNRYLPHHHKHHVIVYSGTHDNDTTLGWFRAISDHERQFVRRYAPLVERDPAWEMIRLAWSSVADYAVAPLQDVLSLGTEARMNLPGRPAGNWGWRFQQQQLHDGIVDRLRDMTELYSR